MSVTKGRTKVMRLWDQLNGGYRYKVAEDVEFITKLPLPYMGIRVDVSNWCKVDRNDGIVIVDGIVASEMMKTNLHDLLVAILIKDNLYKIYDADIIKKGKFKNVQSIMYRFVLVEIFKDSSKLK